MALPVRRPFSFLLLLVLFHLLLLSVQVRTPQGQILLRSWGLFLFTPLASGIRSTTQSLQDLVGRYAVLLRTEEENRRLRLENSRLRQEMIQLRELAALVPRLEEYKHLQEQLDFETVVSMVLWKNAPFVSSRMIINVGTLDSVRKDSAVLNSEGIVGRVLSANLLSSEVELITSHGAAAGALIEHSRLQGVVLGDGSGLLRLDFISNSESVEEGQVVLTSGNDRIYPKGLPIGVVESAQKGPMMYQLITVRPYVNFGRLEEILAVKRPDPDPFLTETGRQAPAAPGDSRQAVGGGAF